MQIVKNFDNKFRDYFFVYSNFFSHFYEVYNYILHLGNEIHVVFDENTRLFDGIFRLTYSYENIGMKR